ncbi:hypothetical protein BDR26DRAFT_853256 [Obelidium mucronatum]|nr:hypothetical protein BDR26DRAFT_853256 [Obelidium mucronatum]
MIQYNMFKTGSSSGGSVFRKSVDLSIPPVGPIATPILESTAPDVSDLDWHSVLLIAESINSDSKNGPQEALNAIKYRLLQDDPVSIFYTLSVLDAFYKNCGEPFKTTLATAFEFLEFDVIQRKTLAIENRGQIMELIAEWGTAEDAHPKFKAFFAKLWKDGYKFSPASLSKLTQEDFARMRKTATSQGLSTKVNLTKRDLSYPQDLRIPTVESTSQLAQYSVKLAKKKGEQQQQQQSLTQNSSTATGSSRTFRFSPKSHYDPRSKLPKFSGEFKWKKGSRVADKEGFALLSDDEGDEE